MQAQARFLIPFLRADKIAAGIDTEKNEKQDCETPKVGASVGEEGQGNADDWREAQYHAYVDEYVEEEHARHAVAIDAPEFVRLSFGKENQPEDKA